MLFTVLISFLAALLSAQECCHIQGEPGMDIREIRMLYSKAVESSEAADQLYEKLISAPESNGLFMAYKASAQALIAKHALNPYTKVKMLKDAEETFKIAINQDPENVEIRFLRFTVQHYIPEWLGFSKNLEEDRKIIVRNLPDQFSRLEKDGGATIIRFLKECGRCSREELSQISKIQSNP